MDLPNREWLIKSKNFTRDLANRYLPKTITQSTEFVNDVKLSKFNAKHSIFDSEYINVYSDNIYKCTTISDVDIIVKSNHYSKRDYTVQRYMIDNGYVFLCVKESKAIQNSRDKFMLRSDAKALKRYLKYNNQMITENENIQFIKDKKCQFGVNCIHLDVTYCDTPNNVEIIMTDSRYMLDDDSFNRIIRCGDVEAVSSIFDSYQGKLHYCEHDMLVNSYCIHNNMIYLFASCDEAAYRQKLFKIRNEREDSYVEYGDE
jgi:hypothetical protein